MFVVAHEIGHIAHGHRPGASEMLDTGRTTVSEMQELQADIFSVDVLRRVLESEQLAIWGAFIALHATFLTESGLYLRRGSSHPEGWARWAVLEKQLNLPASAEDRIRAVMLVSVAGAL